MNQWSSVGCTTSPIDVEVIEESALAMAQSTIQKAINEARISQADLARKMQCNRSMVTRMLSGRHNLTIKTMSRALAACGSEVRFERVPIAWYWCLPQQSTLHKQDEHCPQNAGTAMRVSPAHIN